MFYGFFVFFSVFFISEHLYAKNHHTLNANWQSIFVVLINKKILITTSQLLCTIVTVSRSPVTPYGM